MSARANVAIAVTVSSGSGLLPRRSPQATAATTTRTMATKIKPMGLVKCGRPHSATSLFSTLLPPSAV